MFTSLFQLEQKPVTVFSSGDAGAPILTKTAGSLKTLLKACLVTGYGSKPSLGWQMLFESGDQLSAAFASQDPTASKYVLKVDNAATSTAKISAYQSMTAIDAGVKPMVVDNIYDLHTSEWKLIGHGKAFVLLVNAQYHHGVCAYPIIFGDLPREIKRIDPVCLLWTGRNASWNTGGLQTTLFRHPNGISGPNQAPSANNVVCYPFVVNQGGASQNLTSNYCKFTNLTSSLSSVLYEPVICRLSDSTWTMIPMLQPMSVRVADVGNLGVLSNNSIKAVSGEQGLSSENNDCAVPTDWWWA